MILGRVQQSEDCSGLGAVRKWGYLNDLVIEYLNDFHRRGDRNGI